MTTPYGPADLVQEVHDWLSGRTELEEIRGADLDLAPNTDPPFWVVGPPSWTLLTPASGGGGPSRYRFSVYVVVAESDRAFGELVAWVQLVARALDEPGGMKILEMRPTTFPAGSTELPAYAIDIEVTG